MKLLYSQYIVKHIAQVYKGIFEGETEGALDRKPWNGRV
jgi:hypothetical protein